MFTPVLEKLKKEYKAFEIDFIISKKQKASAKVIENFFYTRKIHYINTENKYEVLRLAFKLRNKYDIFICTSGSVNLIGELFSLIINSEKNLIELWSERKSILKYIKNYKYIKNKYILTYYNYNIHRVEANINLLEKLLEKKYKNLKTNYYLKEENLKFLEKWNEILKKKIIFGIHPGCNKNYIEKRWPIENYLELINNLSKKYINIIIFIGPDDIEIGEILKRKISKSNLYFCEEKDLSNVATLISKCDYFFNNDSGLGHIAGCFQLKKIFTIFGPANPKQIKVYNDNTVSIRIENKDKNYYKEKDEKGILKCLSEISIDKVKSIIEKELL